MTILSEEELEKFKELRVNDRRIKYFSEQVSKKLLLYDEKILTDSSDSYGLLYHIAYEHHVGGKSIHAMAEELELSQGSLRNLLKRLEIPMLNRGEAYRRGHSRNNNSSNKSEERNRPMRNVENLTYHRVKREYDLLVATSQVDDWRELIPSVSERTGVEEDMVKGYLEKLFR